MTTVVEIENATFSYGDTLAVHDVSLTIEEGDFLGLIGPNGSGKTTLLHLMIGLETPDTGSVRLYGEAAHEFEAGERLGYVSQRSTDKGGTMPVTVREAVLMGRFAHVGHRRLGEEDHRIVAEAMETVGIAGLADRPMYALSGGQRQRAYIARALASEAELLALDEPTVGVDAESRSGFYDMLDELNRRGITIVLIEHDVDVITRHVDSVACINQELYHHGDTASFLESDALSEAYGPESAIVEHDHP